MFNEGLWLGSHASHSLMLAIREKALSQVCGSDAVATAPSDPLLSIADGVGVISVRGSLISGNAGFLSYYGLVGYDDIRTSLVAAITDPAISAILLNVDSGGGAVGGVADLANFISRVDAVKPVITYADGMLGSGAYWFGSAARKIVISPTTIAGSIGVIMTHTEVSKARAEAGITDTVIRAGKYKALGSRNEPLTEQAKAQYQAQADEIARVFTSAVATQRKVPYSRVESQLGQGREFIGAQAVSAGIADAVGTFEDALALAKSFAPVDKSSTITQNPRQYRGVVNMPKPTLTAKVLEPQIVLETDPPSGEVSSAVEPTEEVAKPAEADTQLLDYLRAELAISQARNVELQVQAVSMQAQIAETTDTHAGLLAIARESLQRLSVPLGSSAEASANFNALQVIAEHARVLPVYLSKFKIGGIANTLPDDLTRPEPIAKPAVVHHLFRALVPSTK